MKMREGEFISKDYKEEYKQKIRKRNNLNKSRARAMEQRIAKELSGHRIPMSGAGSLKGDGLAYTKLGLLVFECKTSEAVDERYKQAENAFIGVHGGVFEKIEKERRQMNATFGVVVIHHVRKKNDYVVIRKEDYVGLLGQTAEGLTVREVKSQRFKFYKHELDKTIEEQGAMYVSLYSGDFIVITLRRFKELVLDS